MIVQKDLIWSMFSLHNLLLQSLENYQLEYYFIGYTKNQSCLN